MRRAVWLWCAAIIFLVSTAGCTTHHEIESRNEIELAPVEVKPIHITIDINIKVDRALDDFFGDLDKTAAEIK